MAAAVVDNIVAAACGAAGSDGSGVDEVAVQHHCGQQQQQAQGCSWS